MLQKHTTCFFSSNMSCRFWFTRKYQGLILIACNFVDINLFFFFMSCPHSLTNPPSISIFQLSIFHPAPNTRRGCLILRVPDAQVSINIPTLYERVNFILYLVELAKGQICEFPVSLSSRGKNSLFPWLVQGKLCTQVRSLPNQLTCLF